MSTGAKPTAYVAQDFIEPGWLDAEHPGHQWRGAPDLPPLGRARAHIQGGPEARGLLEESEWDNLDEALAWARARTRIVSVRVGYSEYYSAGDDPTEDPPWPPVHDELLAMAAMYPAAPTRPSWDATTPAVVWRTNNDE